MSNPDPLTAWAAGPAPAGPPRSDSLTEWTIKGEIRCPDDCGRYFDAECTLPDLEKFIDEHDCAEAMAAP